MLPTLLTSLPSRHRRTGPVGGARRLSRAPGWAISLIAALVASSLLLGADDAHASDDVSAFPTGVSLATSGQVNGPEVLTSSTGVGLLAWTAAQGDPASGTTTLEVRQNTGAGWSPLILSTNGIGQLTYGADLRLAEDPVTHRILLLASTGTGLWLWVSTDGGLSFSEPLFLDRLSFGTDIAFDGAGGFFITTPAPGARVGMLHVSSTFTVSLIEGWTTGGDPYGVATLGPAYTPLVLLRKQLLLGLDPAVAAVPVPGAVPEDLVASTAGGLLVSVDGKEPGCGTRSRPGCVYLQSISAAGALEPKTQLSGPWDYDVSQVALSVAAGNPSAFTAAYTTEDGGSVIVAQSSTGPAGPWKQTKSATIWHDPIFETGYGKAPFSLESVSQGYVAGVGWKHEIVWVTDTGPVKPELGTVLGKYARRSGKLHYGVDVDGGAATTGIVTVRVKAGHRRQTHRFVLPAQTSAYYRAAWVEKTRLPRKFRKVASLRGARMTMTVRVSSAGTKLRRRVKVPISRTATL